MKTSFSKIDLLIYLHHLDHLDCTPIPDIEIQPIPTLTTSIYKYENISSNSTSNWSVRNVFCLLKVPEAICLWFDAYEKTIWRHRKAQISSLLNFRIHSSLFLFSHWLKQTTPQNYFCFFNRQPEGFSS